LTWKSFRNSLTVRPSTAQQLSFRKKFVSQIEFAKNKNNNLNENQFQIFFSLHQLLAAEHMTYEQLTVTLNSEAISQATILKNHFIQKTSMNLNLILFSAEYLNRTNIKRSKNKGILKRLKNHQQRSKYVSS